MRIVIFGINKLDDIHDVVTDTEARVQYGFTILIVPFNVRLNTHITCLVPFTKFSNNVSDSNACVNRFLPFGAWQTCTNTLLSLSK